MDDMLNLKKWGWCCWVSSRSGWLLKLLTELINTYCLIYKVYKDPLYIQCEGVVQEPESQVAEAAKRGEGPGAEVKGVRDFKWRDFKWQDF